MSAGIDGVDVGDHDDDGGNSVALIACTLSCCSAFSGNDIYCNKSE